MDYKLDAVLCSFKNVKSNCVWKDNNVFIKINTSEPWAYRNLWDFLTLLNEMEKEGGMELCPLVL